MNKSQSTIQIRVDNKIKREAKKTLEEMGLDMSSAVKLFLNNVIIEQKIPFEIRTKNGFTPKQEKEMIREAEEALKYGKRYDSAGELMDDILK